MKTITTIYYQLKDVLKNINRVDFQVTIDRFGCKNYYLMKTKKKFKRKYDMEDAKLLVLSKAKLGFMKRDIDVLTAYGITHTLLNDFDVLVTDFGNFPTDEELSGQHAFAAELKIAKADELRDAMNALKIRVEAKFGRTSARYKMFDFEKLYKWDDANLLIAGRRTVVLSNFFFSGVTPFGLTADLLAALSILCNEFEELIFVHRDKINDREIAKEDRIELGNAVYIQLNDYCKLAKSAWRTSNAATYNDYMIYR